MDIFYILYMSLPKYGCLFYMIYSLVVLNLGNIVVYITCIRVVMPLKYCLCWTVFMLVNLEPFFNLQFLSFMY